MTAAFFGCSCFLACLCRTAYLANRERARSQPSAARMLGAPFRSGSPHVV